MSTGYDLVVAGTITMIMFVIHRIGIEMFAPGTKLYTDASAVTVFDGAELANQWFQIITLWLPVLFIGGIWLWVIIRAYKRQVQTATRSPA